MLRYGVQKIIQSIARYARQLFFLISLYYQYVDIIVIQIIGICKQRGAGHTAKFGWPHFSAGQLWPEGNSDTHLSAKSIPA